MAKTYREKENVVYASFHGGTEWHPVGSFSVADVNLSGCKTDSEKLEKIRSVTGKKVSIACDADVPDAVDFMTEQVYMAWMRKMFEFLYWN